MGGKKIVSNEPKKRRGGRRRQLELYSVSKALSGTFPPPPASISNWAASFLDGGGPRSKGREEGLVMGILLLFLPRPTPTYTHFRISLKHAGAGRQTDLISLFPAVHILSHYNTSCPTKEAY